MQKSALAGWTLRSRATFVLGATLLVGLAGCAKYPKLQQPVGVTMVTSGRADRPAPNRPVIVTSTTEELDRFHLAEQRPGPCGMDRLPSVEFAFGSSEITTEQDAALTRLASCVKDAPFDASRIVLVGRADPKGSPTYNLDLAFFRASRVRRKLMDLGIDPSRLIVTSAGETDLPRDRWNEARRVDFVLVRPAPAPAAE